MGLNKQIENSKIVALDTTIFIYYIEQNPKYYSLLDSIFKRSSLKEKSFKIVTSSITLIEVLTKPIREERFDLVEKYQEILLSSDNIFILTLETNIAKKSAELKAKYNFLRTPDAIQLAAAIYGEADLFISNDKKLKDISEIKCIYLDEILLNV